MATKVRPETIKRLSQMGMARALKEAETSDDPEFKEAIKRYYPKAQFGPKTAAAAKTAEVTQQRAADKDDRKFAQQQRAKSSVSPKPVIHKAAISRRVEPSTGGTKAVARKSRAVPSDKRPQFLGGTKVIKHLVRPPGMKMWPWENKGSKNTPEKSAARVASRKKRQAKNREAALKSRSY